MSRSIQFCISLDEAEAAQLRITLVDAAGRVGHAPILSNIIQWLDLEVAKARVRGDDCTCRACTLAREASQR